MPSQQATVDAILDQLRAVDQISARKMFGEYGLYCGEKIVGTICDDTLFIKLTPEGKAFAGAESQEAPPYPGAKPALQISAKQIADPAWLSELVSLSAAALPAPKPKKPKAAKSAVKTAKSSTSTKTSR